MNTQHAGTETSAVASAAAVGMTTAADYALELERGVGRLRFDTAVETEFRRSHLLRMRTQAKLWQVLQLIAGFGSLSVVLNSPTQGGARVLFFACNAAQLAVSLTLIVVAFTSAYVRFYYRLATILIPFRAAGFAVVVGYIIFAGGSGTSVMTINLFGLLFFSGLLLREALPAALVMTGAFFAALTAFEVHAALAAYSMTSLLVVFGLAGFVAWDTQRAARTAFLEHGLARSDATRDALTGLVNRRHLDARLETLWKEAGEAGRVLTVMLIDVDHFKAYNDGYGHQAGDEVLRRIAQILRAEAGPGDIVARFGGEEFVIVTTGLSEVAAEAQAGRMRRAVEKGAIPHTGAPIAGIVTVSVGGTCIVPLPNRSAAGALQMADQNLYAAKRRGRNRVVFQHDEYTMMQTGRFRRPDGGEAAR